MNNGFLVFTFLAGSFIAVVLSFIIIALYKRAVIRGMNYTSASYKKPEMTQSSFSNYTKPLTFI